MAFAFAAPDSFLRIRFSVQRRAVLRVVGVRVVGVEELHDMKAAPVHVEVDVPLLEVGGDGLPEVHLRVELFDSAPGGVADAPAVDFGGHEQELEIAPIPLHFDHRAAHRLPVRQNAIGFAPVDGRLDDLPGDDLALLLEVVVPRPPGCPI